MHDAREVYKDPSVYARKHKVFKTTFDMLDHDNSGSIDVSEIQTLFNALGMSNLSEETMQKVGPPPPVTARFFFLSRSMRVFSHHFFFFFTGRPSGSLTATTAGTLLSRNSSTGWHPSK